MRNIWKTQVNINRFPVLGNLLLQHCIYRGFLRVLRSEELSFLRFQFVDLRTDLYLPHFYKICLSLTEHECGGSSYCRLSTFTDRLKSYSNQNSTLRHTIKRHIILLLRQVEQNQALAAETNVRSSQRRHTEEGKVYRS